jgi:DNA (cytosine-5)-methyltransferase 1
MLLFEFLRFAEVFQPKAIMIEQVKGLLNAPDNRGTKGGVLRGLVSRLEGLGYEPKMRVMNAAAYGVPQLRERVFIISTSKGVPFSFPAATHGISAGETMSLFPLLPYRTAGEALDGLGEPTEKALRVEDDSHVDVTPEGDRRRIHGVPEGSHLARELHLPQEQRGGLSRKDTTKFRRLSRLAPSNTLRCGEIFFHPFHDRYLTPREYMRLHTYPDTYILKGPIRGRSGQARNLDQHRQVANSVPPLLAKVIASSIIQAIELKERAGKRRRNQTPRRQAVGI